MEDNRFLRAYQENKREKEQASQNYNNRFECLRDNRLPPVRESAGRFECLRGPTNISHQDTRVVDRENNRFGCLASDGYESYPRQQERVHYLPRPEPRESVNAQMRRLQEEKRAVAASKPPPPPVFSFESGYHFPELGKSQETPSNSKMPKPKPEIKLPEPKQQKEMIVKPIVVPEKRKIMTVMSFKGGKVVSKEVYEDGTDIPEEGMVVLKKPTYSSWASVIKKDSNEIQYEEEHKKLSDF